MYVNFSRIDPALLEVENQRIKLRDTRSFSQGVMTGVVTASNIISSVTVGGPNNQYGQHRITLAPFAQEMRRDTSVWGALLNFKVIMATTSDLGFSFITRGEGKSAYSTPCKLSFFFILCFFFADFQPVYGAGPSTCSSASTSTQSTPKRSGLGMFSSVRSPAAPRARIGVAAMPVCRNFEDRSACTFRLVSSSLGLHFPLSTRV